MVTLHASAWELCWESIMKSIGKLMGAHNYYRKARYIVKSHFHPLMYRGGGGGGGGFCHCIIKYKKCNLGEI